MKPQTRAVLALLRERGTNGVSGLEALEAVHVYRLAGRIHELRQAGYPVRSVRVTTPNGAPIVRYVLEPSKPVTVAALPLWSER